MTAAIFSRMTPIDNTEICPTCRSSVEEEPTQEWYGHSVSGGPVIHYAHRECLLELLKNGLSTCPGMCGQRINPDSLVSWKDRVKPFFVNATTGVAVGVSELIAMLGITLLIIAKGMIEGVETGAAGLVIGAVMTAVGFKALDKMLILLKNRNGCDIVLQVSSILVAIFLSIVVLIGIKFRFGGVLEMSSLLIASCVLSGLIPAVGVEIFRSRGDHG